MMLEKAKNLAPNEANIYVNLGITYQNLGQISKANEYFKKAESLNISTNKRRIIFCQNISTKKN